MLKFSPGQKSLLAISFPFTVINRFCSLNNSLKNFQGFFSTVQLSRFAVHLSDATLTFYHVRSCLSTTFLTFLKFLLFPFQELVVPRDSLVNLPHWETNVNSFFEFFRYFFPDFLSVFFLDFSLFSFFPVWSPITGAQPQKQPPLKGERLLFLLFSIFSSFPISLLSYFPRMALSAI